MKNNTYYLMTSILWSLLAITASIASVISFTEASFVWGGVFVLFAGIDMLLGGLNYMIYKKGGLR